MDSDWQVLGIILIILVVIIPPWIYSDKQPQPVTLSETTTAESQVVAVLVDTSFVPNVIELEAGRPAKLVFYREQATECNELVVIPRLGKELHLAAAEETELVLASVNMGEYEFSCGMGMMRGTIRVAP